MHPMYRLRQYFTCHLKLSRDEKIEGTNIKSVTCTEPCLTTLLNKTILIK